MGIHRERLAASRAHRRFVEGARAALQRLGPTVPIPSDISPAMVGAKPLPFTAPPMMEEAFGYRGALRFVTFGYSPRTHRFVHSDGGDDIPSDSDTWLRFMQHPLVSHQLPKNRYPTLYGVIRQNALPSLQELMQSGNQEGKSSEPIHCLLLDRMTRQLYICRRDQAIVFFSLSEPEGATRIFVNGLRMSPGNEDDKVPGRSELVLQVIECLDDEV